MIYERTNLFKETLSLTIKHKQIKGNKNCLVSLNHFYFINPKTNPSNRRTPLNETIQSEYKHYL